MLNTRLECHADRQNLPSAMSHFDIILDESKRKLTEVPERILNMCNLKMLYLEGNSLRNLPDDFFLKLHKLTWLDLRNNKLTSIPDSIAYHEHLENLLLTNNRLERLPNELALVPNLKVLQVSENPLVYPNRKVIAEGIRSILGYLKTQYEKAVKSDADSQELDESESSGAENEKEVAVVMEDSASGYIAESEEATSVRELLRRSYNSSKHTAVEGEVLPQISVKGLSARSSPNQMFGDNRPKQKQGKIVHKINRGGSRVSLRSYYNSNKYIDINKMKNNFDKISDLHLKEEWLNKLKTVLTEQEKILQQEKNLKALTEWRSEKKSKDSSRRGSKEEVQTRELPYATDPEYDRILSREDLEKQIDKMIQRSKHKPKKSSIEKLINELASQLKDMETTYTEMRSPRTKIEEAGKQIKLIMNIHKKLMRLQASNESDL